MDIVHGFSGHCPWTEWTISMDSVDIVHGLKWTLSMDSSGHCLWTLVPILQPDNVHSVHGLSTVAPLYTHSNSCCYVTRSVRNQQHHSCRVIYNVEFTFFWSFSYFEGNIGFWGLTVGVSTYFYNSRELNAEALLDLDIFNLSSTSRDDKKKKAGTSSDLRSDMEDDDELDDKSPLFWQPGKRGYYSPRPGKGSQERLNAFRNIGRLVLVSEKQNEPCHEKTCLQGFRPGKTQTGLLSYRSQRESWNCKYRK